MTFSKRHRILIGTDGSPSAVAAVTTALRFPWGPSTRARAVVAPAEWLSPESAEARSALSHHSKAVADAARRALCAKWKTAEAVVVDRPPAQAILEAAEDFRATVVVLGWRGHGTFKRLLAGSVSRTVAAHAQCPVLVVREAPRALRRFVIGFDGCPNAERALDFLCSLEPAPGSRAVVVNVTQPVSAPASTALLPASARSHVRRQAVAWNQERTQEAERVVAAAVGRLKRSGWSAAADLRVGAPLERLLSAADAHRADALVLGARGISGLERALLGSVANGALNRSRIPVLLVR